jgi:hypothetical protein
MSRFKELERIEAAIEQQNEPELQWALWYAQMRVRVAPNKRHKMSWQKIEREVQVALEAGEDPK